MTVRCVKCDAEITRGGGWRKFLRALGWTAFVVGVDEFWRCCHCGPHKPEANGNR